MDGVEVEQRQLEEEERDVAEVDGFKVHWGQDAIAAGKSMLERTWGTTSDDVLVWWIIPGVRVVGY